MAGGKADIFVEIESDDARKVEMFFAMQANQLAVHSLLRVACGEAEAEIWFFAKGIGDHTRRFAAEFGVVVGDEYEHDEVRRANAAVAHTA